MNHRCRSDTECVSRTPDGAAITTKPGTLCTGCTDDIQRKLDNLPYLTQALQAFKGGLKAADYTSSKVSSSPTRKTPVNIHILDLIDEVGDVVDRVDNYRIADLVRLPAEQFILWRRGSRQNVWLDGVSRALAVRWIHAKVEKTVGLNRVWNRRHAACPECHLNTLGAWVGDDTVHCSSCTATYTREQYDDLCIAESQATRRKKQHA